MENIDVWSQTNMKENGRKSVTVTLYREKDPNANPYYASNQRMYHCILAAKQLLQSEFEWETDEKTGKLLEELYQQYDKESSAASLEEKTAFLMQSNNPKVRDAVFSMTHVLFQIEKIAGGHRYPGEKDTEIRIKALLLPGMSEEIFYRQAQKCAAQNGVKCTK